jgi:uncharacterized protein with PIN domain
MSSAGAPPEDIRLLLDVMLGKLATYLRMCGYDAAYALDRDAEADDRLLELAESEGRLLVTRDAQLARRAAGSSGPADGLLLETKPVTDQLRELANAGFALDLSEPSRCSECNGEVEAVGETDGSPDYAPAPDERRVWRCLECCQHFWNGSHWESVAETLTAFRTCIIIFNNHIIAFSKCICV